MSTKVGTGKFYYNSIIYRFLLDLNAKLGLNFKLYYE